MIQRNRAQKTIIVGTGRRVFLLCLIMLVTAIFLPVLAAGKPLQSIPLDRRSTVSVPFSTNRSNPGLKNELVEHVIRFVAGEKKFEPRGSNRKISTKKAHQISPDTQVIVRQSSGTPRRIKFKTPVRPLARQTVATGDELTSDVSSIKAFFAENKDLLRLEDPEQELGFEYHEKDELGMRHVRFSQYYQSVPVWPAEITVHLNPLGAIDSLDGHYIATPKKMLTRPVITPETAIVLAEKAVPDLVEPPGFSVPELVIHSREGSLLRLAWKITVTLSESARWLVIIDALNGNTIEAFNTIMNAGTTGFGIDVLGQERALNIWEDNGTYYLVDTSKDMYNPSSQPPNFKGAFLVYDAQNYPQTDNPQGIDKEHTIFAASKTATAGWENDAVSLAYFTSRIYDYYKTVHSWQSHDGKGGTLTGIVRYGQNFGNAFMAPENNLFVFGDGDLWTTLDVVAHEFQHGVTFNTANLVYRNQSGAMNEAFSDIFAEMIEYHVNGSNDWIFGSHLADLNAKRSMADPKSYVIAPLNNRPYPARMGEYINVEIDNGGVHLNHTIISHAFYLLAQGLDNAIGREDAAKIFFRALQYHLVQNSQFIDARLACIASAEEIWADNPTKRDPVLARIKEAFDRVELHESAPTPDPISTTRPPVQGSDSAVFIYPAYDPDWYYFLGYYLGRCEDGSCDPLSYYPVRLSRPAVSGDGTMAVFVDEMYDLCFVPTDGSAGEECLGYQDTVYSVAMSPDQTKFAFVLLDPNSGEPENSIMVLEKQTDGSFFDKTYPLVAPVIDGVSVDSILQADALDFSGDGQFLIYDALNIIETKDGYKQAVWSLYALDIGSGQIMTVVPPVPGLDIGYPALAKTSDDFLVFDAYDSSADKTTIYAMNMVTGEYKEIANVPGAYGVPGYTGDDGLVFYSHNDSIWARPVAADHITPTGDATEEIEDAYYAVVYRRGTYTAPAPGIEVAPQTLSFPETPVSGSVQKILTIKNTGTANLEMTEIFLEGDHVDSFAVSPGGCSGQSVKPSGTCTVQVQFNPQSGGEKKTVLKIRSNGKNEPVVSIPLTGTGKLIPRHTISVSHDGSGNIQPDGIVSVEQGDDQSFEFTSGSGYHIAHVIVNGVSVGTPTSHTLQNITLDYTLHVVFAPNPIEQHQIMVTQEGPGSIVPNGTTTLNRGSDQTFSFAPAKGFHLADIRVNGASVGSTAIYLLSNIQADTGIHAIFEADAVAGTGDMNQDGNLDLNDSLEALRTITHQGFTGSLQEDINKDGRIGLAEAVYPLMHPGTAHPFTFAIQASAGANGSIAPQGEVQVIPGGQQAFIMTPENGYVIADVRVDGLSQGPVSTHTFADVRDNAVIHVTFVQDQKPPIQHSITATAGLNGSISPAGKVMVTDQGNQKFIMTPANGYQVQDVTLNGKSLGPLNQYTFVGVTDNATIHVTFAQQALQHSITVIADANTVVNPNGTVLVGHGQSKQFTISAKEGFFLKEIWVDGISKGPLTQYAFENVLADHTLKIETSDIALTGILETEPNNSVAAAQFLGELPAGEKKTVTGKLSSGGMSGDTYTGDVDVFRFKLTQSSKLSFFLDWNGTADVDFGVVVWGELIYKLNGSEKPIQLVNSLSPEDFYIVIGSKTSAADYSFTLQTQADTPYYPNNNAVLKGKYIYSSLTFLPEPGGGSILFMNSYHFDGVSKWQNCSYTSLSGEACYEYGNYQIWYPFIVLEHTESGSDGLVEVLPLEFDSTQKIYINNQDFTKE